MKKTSFIHNPKLVTIVSLFIAIIVGVFGYIQFNKADQANNPSTDIAIKSEQDSLTSIPTDASSTPEHLTLGFLAGGRVKEVSVKVGDTVTQGSTLASLDSEGALGSLMQARAAYSVAKANYDKLLNGATATVLDNARAAVATAQTNLDNVKKQQDILVQNARRNLLNSSLIAEPYDESHTYSNQKPPVISGTYTKNVEGTLKLDVYVSTGGEAFSISGVSEGIGTVSRIIPEPIGDTGLSIQFPSTETNNYAGTSWKITIPNKLSPTYLSNSNAYDLAVQTRDQAVAAAQSALDQAKTSLAVTQSSARSEDVAVAQAQLASAAGALKIAEAAYSNTLITAPFGGTVEAVYVSPGQIVAANAPVIEIGNNK